MKGITVLITFLSLVAINTLSAQSVVNFNNNVTVTENTRLIDKEENSDGISLKRRKQTGIVVYPSPAKDDINIQFEITRPTTIRMNNIIGNVLYETTTSSNTGLYSETLDISNLPKGLYFITIDDGVNAQTKRFVKQ